MTRSDFKQRLSGLGTLGVFIWGLILLLAFSSPVSWLAMGTVLGMSFLLYPAPTRRLLNPRRLVFLGIFALSLFVFSTEPDPTARGLLAAQMTFRALGLLVLVNGIASELEISEIAIMMERRGFKGLGFSLGVALNLLPIINETIMQTWRSLAMRGGLRHQRWRAYQLFLVTVILNSLRRAEEIALAAEARAFDPHQVRLLGTRSSRSDWIPWLSGFVIFIMMWLGS